MAKFNGTVKEFEKFIGPRLRNIVQTSIARKYKKEIAKCQYACLLYTSPSPRD